MSLSPLKIAIFSFRSVRDWVDLVCSSQCYYLFFFFYLVKVCYFLVFQSFQMPPTYFPLRWESTGDQWWYASPIDWAAANGHYDLVRELLRIDSNHLFKLTSLRRIRRLEIVWDDEEQFNDVAKFRSEVAQKLLVECESKKGKKNSLIRAGYGGWLMYTAASAGDLVFVQLLLERNPLLVFGEGEYGVTDILYAAARSKNCEVFRLLFDFAVSPRFLTGKGGLEEHVGNVPSVYRWEMTNRAVHAAARGGNLKILEELLANCSDVLAYRDAQGSTILHAAAGRGQVEVVKYLTSSFDMINSTDHQGNTALHVAASRGQLAAAEALVSSFSALISIRNNAGETFLHKAVSGFQTHAFRRLDRQVGLLRKLLSGKNFHVEEIINVKNNDGRTALHMAILGNIHTDLVQLLMTAPLINVNICDDDGMTPLDYLRQCPNSATSDMLIKKLISAGGMFGCQGHNSRKAIASHLRMQSIGSSPGTSFRISDTEIFLYTGIESAPDAGAADQGSGVMSSSSSEHIPYDSTAENHVSTASKRPSSVNYAASRLKRAFQWPVKAKDKKSEGLKKNTDEGSVESCRKWNKSSDETPAPLRQRFSRPPSLPNNKRTLSVRSHQSSPNAKKRFASGIVHGVMQSMPQVKVSGRSRSSSFSKSSISSPRSADKQKGVCIIDNNDIAGPSCSNQVPDDGNESPNLVKRTSVSKKLRVCFGAPGLNIKNSVHRRQESQSYKNNAIAVA